MGKIIILNISPPYTPINVTYGYGTVAPQMFIFRGDETTSKTVVTAPEGFEVGFTNTVFADSIETDGIRNENTDVYVRPKLGNTVGVHREFIVLSSSGSLTSYNYTPELTVNKAVLTLTAQDKERFFNQPNPELTFSSSGFKNGEDLTALTTQPVIKTTAVLNSPDGIYPITITGATATNYSITTVSGKLTVKRGVPKPTVQAVIAETDMTTQYEYLKDFGYLLYSFSKNYLESMNVYTYRDNDDNFAYFIVTDVQGIAKNVLVDTRKVI